MFGLITPAERTQIQQAKGSDTEFIQLLYRLVFEREAQTAEIDHWKGLLTTEGRSRTWALQMFEQNAEAQTPTRAQGSANGGGTQSQVGVNTAAQAPSWYPAALKNADGSAKIPPAVLIIGGIVAAIGVFDR